MCLDASFDEEVNNIMFSPSLVVWTRTLLLIKSFAIKISYICNRSSLMYFNVPSKISTLICLFTMCQTEVQDASLKSYEIMSNLVKMNH